MARLACRLSLEIADECTRKRRGPEPQSGKEPENVLLWVRFWPNGGIATIDHRPEHLSPYDWFTILNEEAALVYTPLTQTSRGYWRLSREKIRGHPRQRRAGAAIQELQRRLLLELAGRRFPQLLMARRPAARSATFNDIHDHRWPGSDPAGLTPCRDLVDVGAE
jgi:hypothetical protein